MPQQQFFSQQPSQQMFPAMGQAYPNFNQYMQTQQQDQGMYPEAGYLMLGEQMSYPGMW